MFVAIALISLFMIIISDNLVYHYDSFIYENRLVLTMDIIQSQTLKTYLQNGSPSEQQIERIAKEILKGLIFLHKKQCVHNGIRAENILLDEQDKLRPKVGGFSQMNNPRPLNFPSHHAPELYTQNEIPNQRSDVWSYGMTLYEMSIRGSHVYRHDSGECLSSTQIIYALITERLPFTDNVNNITEWTESKLQQCLQWNPADRPTFSDLNL